VGTKFQDHTRLKGSPKGTFIVLDAPDEESMGFIFLSAKHADPVGNNPTGENSVCAQNPFPGDLSVMGDVSTVGAPGDPSCQIVN
jgi:hypothetical protein